MYLLDTNHRSKIIKGDDTLLLRLKQTSIEGFSVCTTVFGELVFMACNSGFQTANLEKVLDFCSRLRFFPLDSETGQVYGRLKAVLLAEIGPKEAAKRRGFRLQTLGIHDNDLWIASVAIQHDLVVLTGDKDFARIAKHSALQHESWL